MLKGIDFCICTYNRIDYLKSCAEALLPQIITGKTMLTIVDNGSNDGTKTYVESLQKENVSIRYVFTKEKGLSNARNAGWQSSSFEWIFYLDDDCLPQGGWVMSALKLIEQKETFDAYGGPIDPVFQGSVPDWLPEDFGRFKMPFQETTRLTSGFIRGGCFLVKRNALEKLGGFDVSLGVTGNELRYGEEIDLQVRMRNANFSIGYAPSLRIGHFLRTEKLNVRWMLISTYARHRDKMTFNPVSLGQSSVNLIKTSFGRIIWTPVHVIQSMTRKGYSFRRACLDILKPIATTYGEWIGAWRNHKNSKS